MKVLTESIYAYEVEVETSKGVGEPIFTFKTSIKFEDVRGYAPMRARARAYFADFYPHSTGLRLSQPSNWTEWVDAATISEAMDSLASIVDPEEQAPPWVLELK